MNLTRLLVATAALVLLSQMQHAAAFVYTEGTDLSGNPGAPTPFTLSVGDNTITAHVGAGDLDYFSVNLPTGFKIEHLYLDAFQSGSVQSFLGAQAGSTIVAPGSATPDNLLGFAHFGTAANAVHVGQDFLNVSPIAFERKPFGPPLTGPSYTFWVQEASGSITNYQLRFAVTGVPEPSTWTLMALGLLATGWLASARRRAAQ